MPGMVCPRCGRVETDPTARFCDVDGTRLEPAPGTAARSGHRRGPPWGAIMTVAGLVLLGVAVWMMWGAPPEVDVGTVEVGGDRERERGRGESAPEGDAGREAGGVEGLLRRCYGDVPELPATRGGREAGAFEAAKRAARVGVEVATAGTEPLNPEDEQRFADGLARKMHLEHRVSEDPDLAGRVERIAARLRRHSTRYGGKGYTFEVLDSQDTNAFMGPGGRGYVFRGLLDSLRSDDALAFVLAHELAHSESRHLDPTLRAAKQGGALGEALGGEAGRGVGEVAGGVAAAIMRVTYDQDQEYEADRLGLCLAFRAGFAPDAGVRAMEALGEGEKAPRSGALRIAYDIVVTHPPIQDRRAYLARLADRLKERGR